MKDDLVNETGDLVNDLVNDTISRAAAIDALDKVAEMFPYRIPGKAKTYRQYNEAWSDAIDAAENALESLPSAQPGWIPTSVRLPEEKTAVLITTTKGCVIQCMYWGYQNGHHTWRSLGNQYLYWEMDVVAWMPLPKPWEGGQDGKN